MLKTVIHATGVAWFGYAIYYNLYCMQLPPHIKKHALFEAMSVYPGRWKYLTVWDIVLQLVYNAVALINDVAGSSEVSPKRQSALQRLRDGLFASWTFPIGLFVSTSFWSLYAIDRELVFPKAVDDYYPNWLNHAAHSGPILFMLLELYITPRSYPSRTSGLLGNTIFTLTYLSWITWVYTRNGVWAYPILHVLNNIQRAVFFAGCYLAILGFYFLGVNLNQRIWGAPEECKAVSSNGKIKKVKAKLI